MAMFLARLLGRSDDSLLIHTINNFEKTTHSSNVDVVLISDIWKKSNKLVFEYLEYRFYRFNSTRNLSSSNKL